MLCFQVILLGSVLKFWALCHRKVPTLRRHRRSVVGEPAFPRLSSNTSVASVLRWRENGLCADTDLGSHLDHDLLFLVTFTWFLSHSLHIWKHSFLLGLLKGPAEVAHVKRSQIVAVQAMLLVPLTHFLSLGAGDEYSECV